MIGVIYIYCSRNLDVCPFPTRGQLTTEYLCGGSIGNINFTHLITPFLTDHPINNIY